MGGEEPRRRDVHCPWSCWHAVWLECEVLRGRRTAMGPEIGGLHPAACPDPTATSKVLWKESGVKLKMIRRGFDIGEEKFNVKSMQQTLIP